MPSFSQTEQDFAELERGEARMAAMRDAIREADRQQDSRWRFQFRYDYLEESIFSGDRYSALIVFPELLKLYDDTPILYEDAAYAHNLLVCFRWIVEAAPEFPQISREQIDGYFREFKKRLRQQGKSLSIYYQKRCLFYMHVDRNIAAMCFYRFLEEELDDISDGRSFYHEQQVEYYLSIGEEEKALKAAAPVLDGSIRSDNVPQLMRAEFARYYTSKSDFDKAMQYAKPIERIVDGNPYYHDLLGTLLTLYSVCEPKRAVELFNRNYTAFAASKNPWLRMLFAIGAAHLFAQVKQHPELQAEIHVPYTGSVQELGEQMAHTAADYAAKFDARNGTDDYMQRYLHPFEKE